MIRNSPIRPLSWASAASRRLFSPSLAGIFESPEASVEIKEEKAPPIKGETKPPIKGERKDYVPLYRRISSLGGAPAGSVFRTMNQWTREGRPTRAEDLMKYVRDLRKFRRYKHALELMDWMVKVKGMNMSYTNHAIRIDLLSKAKGIEAAEDYFSKLPEAAKVERTYGALFNCYCFEKMLDKALAFYEKMKELGFASNCLLHNNLMGLYMRLEQPEKVPILFQEMKAINLNPDTVTYCIVMTSYASMDDIDSVERVMHEMEGNKELTIQWNAYSTLAGIYVAAGRFQKAESALRELESLIDSRDREPFHFLISLYASTGNLAEVNRVWKSLKETFVKCTNMSYLTMLQALSKLDDIEGLRQCYEEWERIHVTYDPRLTNTVIGGYLRKDMIEEAESLYAKTKEKQGELDFRTCELFMGYHLKNNEMSSALKRLEVAAQMVNVKGWKLSAEHISLFLQHYENTKDADGIEKFCDILKKLNSLTSSAFEYLIYTYAAADRRDPSLRKRIKEENIELNSETQKLLDKVCASEH